MNKADLIRTASAISGHHEANVERVLNAVIYAIKAEIKSGGTVKLIKFGTFSKKKCQPRSGFNLKTGQAIVIPETLRPKFTGHESFIEELNS